MKKTVQQVRCVENGRIAYYRQKADATFGDFHWEFLLKKENYQGAMNGCLGDYQ